jgi:WD40 repeat protein
MAETIMKTTDDDVAVLDLKLDGENTSKNEDQPRRLVRVPSNTTGSDNNDASDFNMLVYGGVLGLIRSLQVKGQLKNSDGSNPENDSVSLDKECLPRRWDEDEDIRAVAISNTNVNNHESRVALGCDSGCTLFLLYNNVNDTMQEHHQHPFVIVNADMPHGPKCRMESGPSFAAPVRDIQFHPQSSDWIVIATEEGLCMVHFQFSSDATYTQYFRDETAKAHDGSGIRCVCFSPSGDIVASLGMDGRLCIWYVSLKETSQASKPHHRWTLIHRDATRCITKRDTGEILGADAWDRSCRPYFLTDSLLVIPGETYLQIRHIHSTNSNDNKPSWSVTEQIEETKGHVESIVSFTSFDDVNNQNRKYLIAAGRDKRITLWSVDLMPRSKVTSISVRLLFFYLVFSQQLLINCVALIFYFCVHIT